MSDLSPGTLCIIVGGCPENIGIVVEVIEHLWVYPPRADAYKIKVVGKEYFPQFRSGSDGHLVRGYSDIAITDRHKLMPLEDPDNEFEELKTAVRVPVRSVT